MQESGAPNKLYFFPFLQKEDLTILYKILNERNLKIRNNSLSKIKKQPVHFLIRQLILNKSIC